jgi:hypothetical protein
MKINSRLGHPSSGHSLPLIMCCSRLCFTLQGDDVGVVYQDVDSQAAVLVNRDADDDAVLMVSISMSVCICALSYTKSMFGLPADRAASTVCGSAPKRERSPFDLCSE